MHRSPAVRARGISKSFGEVIALDGVDLDVAAGQVHGLVGPNGAGKTTLLGLLLGLAVADSGTLEILGTSGPPDARAPRRRRRFRRRARASTPRSPRGRTSPPSPRCAATAPPDVDDALDQVGLTDVADDRVRGFSLGMRQRLGLAAALLTQPAAARPRRTGERPRPRRHPPRAPRTDRAGRRRHGRHPLQPPDGRPGRAVQRGHHPGHRPGGVLRPDQQARGRDRRARLPAAHVRRRSPPGGSRRTRRRIRVLPDDDLLQRQDAEALLVRAVGPGARRPRRAAGRAPAWPYASSLRSWRRSRRRSWPSPRPRTPRPGPTGDDDNAMTAAPVALPHGRRAAARRPARLPLRAGQAAGPVADPPGAAGLLARARRCSWPSSARRATLPSDTVFGRWMGQTGWAGSLVVLSFCCSWVLPLLTSLVAGDVFAAEDRLGTWRHLLVAVRSPRRIFVGQGAGQPHRDRCALRRAGRLRHRRRAARASATGRWSDSTATCSRPGTRPARCCSPGLSVLAPTLAFAAVGLLGSVAFGRSPMGLLMPVLLAFVLAARAAAAAAGRRARRAAELRLPRLARAVHRSGADRAARRRHRRRAWPGRWPRPRWPTGMFLRRDFTDLAYDGAGRRVARHGACCRWPALLAVTVGVLAARHPGRPAPASTGPKLRELARHRLRAPLPAADAGAAPPGRHRGSNCAPARPATRAAPWSRTPAPATTGAASSPGTSPAPRPSARPSTSSTSPPTAATSPTGTARRRSTASSRCTPPTGDAPNPLWQFDGSVDLLAATPKG